MRRNDQKEQTVSRYRTCGCMVPSVRNVDFRANRTLRTYVLNRTFMVGCVQCPPKRPKGVRKQHGVPNREEVKRRGKMDNPVLNMAKVINNRKMREQREAAEEDIRVRRARW